MAITVQCDACQTKYNVGDAMAGKNVRCKHCGRVFPVPAPTAESDEPDLSGFDAEEGSPDRPIAAPKAPPPPVVMAQNEDDTGAKPGGRPGASSGRALPKRPLGEPIIEREEDEEADDEEEAIFAPALPANPAFRFPASELLDTVLPYLLALLSIGWLIARATDGEDLHTSSADHSWLAHVRWVSVLFIYTILIFPITLLGVHRAGTKLHFGMPSAHYWKVFAVFALPFALGAILSMVSGSPPTFIAGVGVGLGAALGAFWFLFRLNPRQTSGGLITVGAYYIVGVIVAVGLLVGVNLVLFSILKASNTTATFPKSPLGPAFAWNVPPPEPAPAKRKVVSTATEPATNEAPPATQPGPTDPSTPLVGTPVESPLGAVEDIVFPTFGEPSLILTVKSRRQIIDELELWSAPGLVRKAAFQPQHPAETRSVYVLSPRGVVARLVDFPRLAVEIRAADGTVIRTVELEAAKFRNAALLGFVAGNQLALLRDNAGGTALELIDIQSGQIARTLELPGFGRSPGNIALSPDGELLAIALRSASGPALQLTNLGSAADRGFAEQIPLSALDPDKPVNLSGVAFSPDGRKLAILYEEKGNRLVRSWQVADGKQLSEWISFGTAPEKAPDYRGAPLDWLPDGAAWLIYGRYVVDGRRGKDLGTFDLADLRGHHFLGRDTVAIIGTSDSGTIRMTTARLNLEKIAFLENPTPATHPTTAPSVFDAP